MAYPASADSFPTRVDGVDNVVAADYNGHSAAIVSIETTLGLNPQGSAASVAARITAAESAIGAEMYRASTSATDTGSNVRVMAGFDTLGHVDSGFTATLATSSITVPATGYYLIAVHARLSTPYTGGQATVMCLDGGGVDILRGDFIQSSTGGISDMHGCTAAYVASGAVLKPNVFTNTSASLAGNANGTYYYFRVVKL